jgi:uncharacterized protein YqjF (DUF2071 family)
VQTEYREGAMTTPFLTAEWRDLLIINYEVDAGLLVPLLPTGTELDLWRGQALISLVGFRFLDTRVRGFAIPGHRNFEELNLRFYVTRRTPTGAFRRGVCFAREFVPRSLIALVARAWYGEPYRALPMRHRIGPSEVSYEVKEGGRWGVMSARSAGEWTAATARDDFAFITEHYWGYTRRTPGRTDEYEVRHPVWRLREATQLTMTLDVGALYGASWATALAAPPVSAFIAEGSPVEVHPGGPIALSAPSGAHDPSRP